MDIFKDEQVAMIGKQLAIGGVAYSKPDFRKLVERRLMEKKSDPAVQEIIMEKGLNEAAYKQRVNDIYNDMVSTAKAAKVAEIQGDIGSTFKIKNVRNNCHPVIDAASGEVYIYNEALQRIQPRMTLKAFWGHFTKGEKEQVEQNRPMHVANCVFSPEDPRALYFEKDETYLNIYQRPAWRYEDLDNQEEPTIFIEFLNYLFKEDQEQIDYVMRWLYRLIYSRNDVALCFNGIKGSGKTLFYEIAKQLVGLEYCSEAPKSFGKKEFNEFLRNRVLVGVEEHRISMDSYQTIKSYFNPYQTIEGKNKAVGVTEKISVNFIFNHNDVGSLYLERSERRFSLMDITTTSLREAWGREKTDKFASLFMGTKDSPFITQIGAYITNYCKDMEHDSFELYKGKKYQEAIDYHLSLVIKAIVAMYEDGTIDSEEKVEAEEINDRAKQLSNSKGFKPYRGATAQTHILEYRYRDKYSLGTVINPTGNWYLEPNMELIRLIEREQEENEDV